MTNTLKSKTETVRTPTGKTLALLASSSCSSSLLGFVHTAEETVLSFSERTRCETEHGQQKRQTRYNLTIVVNTLVCFVTAITQISVRKLRVQAIQID